MAFIDNLEYRFGRFAIPGITRILAGFQFLVFMLALVSQNGAFLEWLRLDSRLVMEGQVWRLFTYMFLPTGAGPFSIIIQIWVLWFIGDALEQAWGSFRLNLFIFSGMIALTIVAFWVGVPQSNYILIETLFLAFATLFPDVEFALYFILPVKAKWLGMITGGLIVFQFIGGDYPVKMSIIAGVASYLLFFGPGAIRAAFFKAQVADRRQKFESAVREVEHESMHSCNVCKRTDTTNPELDFRVARDGEEYCIEHLPK